jgi:hypothetical protein
MIQTMFETMIKMVITYLERFKQCVFKIVIELMVTCLSTVIICVGDLFSSAKSLRTRQHRKC